MRKYTLLLLTLCVLFPTMGFAQQLSGRVLSESGAVAAGVTVAFKNKDNTIVTGKDGSFKIMATKLPDTLVFSAVGYESYKVVITEKNIKDPGFEVVLLNHRAALDEVVVTGYGARHKKAMREPVAVTSSPAADYSLSGKVSGVEVSHSEAKVRIRGAAYGTPKPSAPSSAPGMISKETTYHRGDTIGQVAPVRSKLLTAGEVNDFTKWKMWSDYTDNEFKSMSDAWGITPKERYAVQLTDKHRNAVVNEPLYLIGKTSGDTLWKAYSDNTGKAELWASFFNNPANKEPYFIADSRGNRLDHPAEFSNSLNLFTIDQSCQVSDIVDIAFVVDATGSMADEIEFLKLELEDVMQATMKKYASLTLNAASVFYRDKGDAYLVKNTPFNDDLLKTLNFIKLQSAGGGGDTPEAVDEALSMALDSLQWNKQARTRLLFLVLDAPPHAEAKERMQQLTARAAAMGVRIVPIACSGTDKSTEFLLRSMALATNGTYTFLTDKSGIGNPHIEPTTDKYETELLNTLLQRLIGQFLYAKDCSLAKDEPAEAYTKQHENLLSVKIAPNPTTGRFTIDSKKEIKEIFVADFTGKILMRLPAAGKKGKWQVDISNYPSGVYLVKYITEDNKWGAEKIVLVHS